MVRIELFPDLSHCIETIARREYWNLVRDYFHTGEENSQFQEKIELLRNFVESTNFRKLRRNSEKYLRDGKRLNSASMPKEEKLNA